MLLLKTKLLTFSIYIFLFSKGVKNLCFLKECTNLAKSVLKLGRDA